MKQKSSLSLPPDPDSIIQAIKRVHLQSSTWPQCLNQNSTVISFENNGWAWSVEESIMVPVWFTGSQLPLLVSDWIRFITVYNFSFLYF